VLTGSAAGCEGSCAGAKAGARIRTGGGSDACLLAGADGSRTGGVWTMGGLPSVTRNPLTERPMTERPFGIGRNLLGRCKRPLLTDARLQEAGEPLGGRANSVTPPAHGRTEAGKDGSTAPDGARWDHSETQRMRVK
jgi:hypothetical protein